MTTSAFEPDLRDKSRCASTHWSLPVQCVLAPTHRENWHEAWHPTTGNRLRYRHPGKLTEELRHGEWHTVPVPIGAARIKTIRSLYFGLPVVEELLGEIERLAPLAPGQFPTVTLCGSMRFYPRMLEVAAELTSLGRIVLMPHDASLTGIPNKTAIEHGAMLDAMHRAKIRMSQLVYVVNTGGYVGESTRSEIDYAAELGIPIEYDFASTPADYDPMEG